MDKRTQSANSSAEDERNMFLVNSQASTLSTVQAIIGNKTYRRCFSPIFGKNSFQNYFIKKAAIKNNFCYPNATANHVISFDNIILHYQI